MTATLDQCATAFARGAERLNLVNLQDLQRNVVELRETTDQLQGPIDEDLKQYVMPNIRVLCSTIRQQLAWVQVSQEAIALASRRLEILSKDLQDLNRMVQQSESKYLRVTNRFQCAYLAIMVVGTVIVLGTCCMAHKKFFR